MATRTGPIIIQLVVTYIVIAFVVRAIRRARKASASGEKHPEPDALRRLSKEFGLEHPRPSPPAARAPSPTSHPSALRREERMYNGVVWQMVHRPHRDLSEGSGSRAAGDEVYVEEPPRCPKCGLGVIETHSWLGYTWACPECGTRARSSSSIEETAKFLARRH
jgi:predicted RNA-binding Zn-ribbon protein involved in translation (DUF1610 family)